MARPSEYSPAVANAICERLADGESLRSICGDAAMPARSTVFKWLADVKGFSDQYARAKDAQADSKFEQAWDIAASATAENVQIARLQVDTIKWQTSKLAPKKYGDKLAIGGDDALGPLTVVINKPA